MGMSDDYYDFHCGNDPRLVKIAIINDHFHTITIRANIAKTIDFSGGTRRVETIRLNKCFKTTRIIWPERTGAIRRLYIYQSDALTKLDLSALTSLEELSILNCRSLEEVTGLSDSLKEINIHNVKLDTLDISHLQKLQKINLITSADFVNLNASSLHELQIAAVSTRKVAADKTLHSLIDLSHCHSLHTIYVDTGDNLLDLKLSDCTGLQEAAILCGKTSKLTGLQDSKNLEFFHAPQRMEMNEVSSNLAKQFKTGNPTEKLESLFEMTQEFFDAAKLTKAGIHDRETIIQETGSQVEVDKANAAKIMLLGTPLDIQMALNKKDLSKELRQVMIDNTYFPPAPLSPLYFLPQVAASEYADQAVELGIPRTRIVNKQNPTEGITFWLENPEGFMPNLLLIEQNAMNTPSVLNFLKLFRKNPNVITYANKQYFLRPYDKIVMKGDWYRLKNRLPSVSRVINKIPKATLAAPIGVGLLASADALAAYQNMLLVANNLITQRMMESNRTLSHRSKNIQILKQAAEMKRLAREFFYYLEQLQHTVETPQEPQAGTRKNLDIPPQREIRYDTPDGQDNIDAESEGPKRAREIPPRQPQAGARRNLDIPPQTEIRYTSPDDQDNIDAESDIPPDMYGKKALQVPLDPPPPDMHGKKALQVPLDLPPPDMHGKKALQIPIEPPPPDMHGKKAPQHPIDSTFTEKGLQNVPPMHATPTMQQILERAKKLADEIKNLKQRAGELPEQILIDEESISPPGLQPKIALQTPIDANHHAHGLATAPPLNPKPTHQDILGAAKKLADAVKIMTNNTTGIPEQTLIDAEALSPPDAMTGMKSLQHPIGGKSTATGLISVPPLYPENNQQRLLETATKLANAVKKMTDHTTGIPEQILVHAESISQQPLAPRPELLTAAKDLAIAVRTMLHDTDGLPEQTLIHVETLHQEAPAANEIKLLDASRKLAEAMQKLATTACAIDTSKSSPSAKAAVALVDTSIKEFKKDIKKISLLDAAGELIISMKLLAKACSNELPLTEKSELAQNKTPELRSSIFKILQNAHRQYIKDHDLLNPGANLFGRTPGKEEMRAEILARFIDALINVKALDPEIVDKEFAKLMKDTDLKYALGGIETEIKICLTGMMAPEPKPAPSNKLDDID